MPELPEVEHLRRTLWGRLRGASITEVSVARPSVLDADAWPRGRASSPARALLVGAAIERLARHGKHTAIIAKDGRVLVVHLGMTGQLAVERDRPLLPNDHRHVTWNLRLRSGAEARLTFRDPRRFGGLVALPSLEALVTHWAPLGPDALDAEPDRLLAALVGRRAGLKALLLDQRTVAGVGNIYADESLFRARLHPRARADRLPTARLSDLVTHVQAVLQEAVASHGSSLRDYRDAAGEVGSFQSKHQVYGRGDQPCLRCGTTLRSATCAGRTTVWCPSCQLRSARSAPHR